jgi:serine/threonine-protein kinase
LEPLPLHDFELAGPLGSGATSRVFAARHRVTGELVAIKMLEPSHRNSAELRERLHREALMLAGVASPHVGRVLGFGYEEEVPFLVLERLTGETLADVLKRDGRVQVDPLANWIEQLLLGVRDCHSAGVIHRDIKPANIFLVDEQLAFPPGMRAEDAETISTSEGTASEGHRTVKLIDFGVARLKEIAQAGRSLTSTHHLLGSMGYMAPEQFQYAKGVGVQADLYAIGVVIFRCLSGRLPFISRSFETLIKMKLESNPPHLSSMPGIGRPNEALDAFIATALQPNPSSRFDNASAMLEAWWRVTASLDRDSMQLEAIEVVFDDDVEVSTDVIASGAPLSQSLTSMLTESMQQQTMAEPEATTLNTTRPPAPGAGEGEPSALPRADEDAGADDWSSDQTIRTDPHRR